MKVEVSFALKVVLFKFFPDEGDSKLYANEIHLSSRSCYFELPFEISAHEIHPDLLALSILLLCYPFIEERLDLDFSVSEDFSNLCKNNLGISVSNTSGLIEPRKVENGIPAMAYSGGVDSTAALALMPEKRIVYFIDRVQPYAKKTLYNKFAAIAAFDEVQRRELHAHRIPTDFEYLRSKVGFPVDPLNVDIPHPVAVPALLMADFCQIDSISYGVIMESVYMVGHEKFEDYLGSEHYSKWTPFFNLVECRLFLPTAGITEVGTAIITERTRFSHYIRSCMRGDENGSCGKCIKCLRKSLLISSIKRDVVSISATERNLDSAQVVLNLYGVIHQHENIYRYIANFLPENKLSKLLRERLLIDVEDCSWMEGWFPDAIELVPEKYRIDFLMKVFLYLPLMSVSNVNFVKSWDASQLRNNDGAALVAWQQYLFGLASPSVRKFIKDKFN